MSSTDDRDGDSQAAEAKPTSTGQRPGGLDAPLTRRLRTLVVAAVVLVAGLSALVILAPSSEAAVICVLLPQEDSPFSHKPEIEAAMTMAVEELNEWGGIGDTEIELVIEETEVDADAVASLFEQIEIEKHPIAYSVISCELLALVAPLAEEVEVPLIGLASAPGLTEGYEWTYRYYVSPELEANSTIGVLDMLGVESLGVLYMLTPHGCGLNDLLIDEFEATGGAVESQACTIGDLDFTEEVEALSDNEAIFVVAHCTTLVAMFSAIEESGYTGHLLASSCASSPRLRETIPQPLVYVSAPILYKSENILAIEFTEKFSANFDIPFSHHAAVGYDIVYLVHDLLEGRDITREVLGERLATDFVFSGVMGSMRIESGVHDFVIPVYPAIVLEGELSYL